MRPLAARQRGQSDGSDLVRFEQREDRLFCLGPLGDFRSGVEEFGEEGPFRREVRGDLGEGLPQESGNPFPRDVRSSTLGPFVGDGKLEFPPCRLDA